VEAKIAHFAFRFIASALAIGASLSVFIVGSRFSREPKVPVSTLIQTLIQPEDETMKIVSFRNSPVPLNGAFLGDRA
jgi:hypothetical protein